MALSTNPDDISRELQRLRNEFDGVKSIINGWTMGGSPDPSFRSFRADFGEFLRPPLDSVGLSIVNTPVTITNANWTILNFDVFQFRSGDAYSFSTAASFSSFVSIRKFAAGHVHLLNGYIDFNVNSSGFRGVAWTTGSTGGTFTMAKVPAAVAGDTFVPFSVPVFLGSNTTSIGMEVYQNSGGNLDVLLSDLLITRIALE